MHLTVTKKILLSIWVEWWNFQFNRSLHFDDRSALFSDRCLSYFTGEGWYGWHDSLQYWQDTSDLSDMSDMSDVRQVLGIKTNSKYLAWCVWPGHPSPVWLSVIISSNTDLIDQILTSPHLAQLTSLHFTFRPSVTANHNSFSISTVIQTWTSASSKSFLSGRSMLYCPRIWNS